MGVSFSKSNQRWAPHLHNSILYISRLIEQNKLLCFRSNQGINLQLVMPEVMPDLVDLDHIFAILDSDSDESDFEGFPTDASSDVVISILLSYKCV